MPSRLVAAAFTFVLVAGCGTEQPPSRRSEPAGSESAGESGTATATRGVATFESLMTSVQQSAQNENYGEAITFAERALELRPDDLPLLFLATQYAEQHGMQLEEAGSERPQANVSYRKAAQFLRAIQKTEHRFSPPQLSFVQQVFYNEARAYATENEPEKAFASLEAAFAAGFENYSMIKSEADFASLRKLPEFQRNVEAPHQEHRRLRKAYYQTRMASLRTFPFDFNLVSTTGKPVKLDDYQGKVLIVDFWGTWCPPCRQEIPHFLELLANHQAAGLEIVGINYERNTGPEMIQQINDFAQEYGITYPCLPGDDATQNRVPGFTSFPTTLFIDRSGKVRLKVEGYHDYDDLEAIVQILLAEEAEPTTDRPSTP